MTSDEVVQRLLEELSASQIPFMVVGSFSSNVYGLVRSTRDVDVVVVLEVGKLNELAQRLDAELRLDPQPGFESVTFTTYYRLYSRTTSFLVELFALSEDEHDLARWARRVEGQVVGRQAFVPTPEDVIITKLRWYAIDKRMKDLDDVRNVVAVQDSRLDWDYIHRWCEVHGSREHLDAIRESLKRL